MAKVKKKTTKKLPASAFKKGNKAGVGHGRPRVTAEQREMRIRTRTDLRDLLIKYSELPIKEIRALIRKAALPIFHMAALKHLEHAWDSGSMDRLDWTMNHIAGQAPKAPTQIELTAKRSLDVTKLSKEELLALKEMAEKSNGQ